MKKDSDNKNPKPQLTWNKESLKILQDSMLDQVGGYGTMVCSHAGYTEYDTSCDIKY